MGISVEKKWSQQKSTRGGEYQENLNFSEFFFERNEGITKKIVFVCSNSVGFKRGHREFLSFLTDSEKN